MPVLLESDNGICRSAVYNYLRPALLGRRVLEIGCGTGESAAYLLKLGARSVIAAGQAQEVAEARKRHHEGAVGFVAMGTGLDTAGPFDLVIIPDAAAILRGKGPLKLSMALSLIAPGGRLACIVGNGDQGEGVGYYDLVDFLSPHFSKVRMFGQTPFVGFGVAEFDESAADLRVETALAAADESPSHYIAIAGPDEPLNLGYALVQIPTAEKGAATFCHGPGTGTRAPDSAMADLRQKLAEVEGKADGLVRVSRAQVEEIEELRARIRRTAEARAELDEEVRRLRRSLIEADESVVSLTRRTAEEMSALTQRLTSGLRVDEPARPQLAEELKRHETLLAQRESALTERDDRIAQLETSRQEAEWRLASAEEELVQARIRLQVQKTEKDQALASLRRDLDQIQSKTTDESQALKAARARIEELSESLRQKELSIEEYRKAGALHLKEVHRLRDASHEMGSHVSELEDEVAELRKRQTELQAEADRAKRTLIEVEDADRQRRSRLAELEGKMLRLEHQGVAKKETDAQDQQEIAALRATIKELEGQLSAGQSASIEMDRLRRDLSTAMADTSALRETVGEVVSLRVQLSTVTSDAAFLREKANQASILSERFEAATMEIDQWRSRLQACEQARPELEKALVEKDGALAELAAVVRGFEEKGRRLAELRLEAPDPEEVYERLYDFEMQYQAATMAAARVPALEARVAELESLLDRRGA